MKLLKRSEARDATETEEQLVEVVWARDPQWSGKDVKIVRKVRVKLPTAVCIN